jgi:hypothetical protein
MTTQETTQETAPFVSQETLAAFVASVVKAAKTHAGADRNLVGSLLASARDLERVVTDDDWTAHLAKVIRKGIAAKVAPDSVKVYLSHAKTVTIAATGRPLVSDALPLGKHWADQVTTGRKLEGINAYVKRVGALLKVATRNEAGELFLPEGYSLMGVPTASPEAETPVDQAKADAEHAAQHAADEAAIGSAGQSADAEGGLNVDPATAKADALEAAAIVLMGSPKAARAFLDLIADKAGKDALAKLMRDHATAAAVAKAKEAADAKAGESLNA